MHSFWELLQKDNLLADVITAIELKTEAKHSHLESIERLIRHLHQALPRTSHWVSLAELEPRMDKKLLWFQLSWNHERRQGFTKLYEIRTSFLWELRNLQFIVKRSSRGVRDRALAYCKALEKALQMQNTTIDRRAA
jgi:hypothetical protein